MRRTSCSSWGVPARSGMPRRITGDTRTGTGTPHGRGDRQRGVQEFLSGQKPARHRRHVMPSEEPLRSRAGARPLPYCAAATPRGANVLPGKPCAETQARACRVAGRPPTGSAAAFPLPYHRTPDPGSRSLGDPSAPRLRATDPPRTPEAILMLARKRSRPHLARSTVRSIPGTRARPTPGRKRGRQLPRGASARPLP